MGLWPTSASAALAEPAFLLNATPLVSRIGSKPMNESPPHVTFHRFLAGDGQPCKRPRPIYSFESVELAVPGQF